MPAGELVTVPVPEPPRVTVSLSALVSRLKVAVTLALLARATVQGAVPVQAPVQPAKDEPDAGEAVKITLVFSLKVALHVEPQSMPAGVLVTVPVPEPVSVTESSLAIVSMLNIAVTAALLARATVHLPIPVHAPDHPAKAEPDVGEAVNVILVF